MSEEKKEAIQEVAEKEKEENKNEKKKESSWDPSWKKRIAIKLFGFIGIFMLLGMIVTLFSFEEGAEPIIEWFGNLFVKLENMLSY